MYWRCTCPVMRHTVGTARGLSIFVAPAPIWKGRDDVGGPGHVRMTLAGTALDIERRPARHNLSRCSESPCKSGFVAGRHAWPDRLIVYTPRSAVRWARLLAPPHTPLARRDGSAAVGRRAQAAVPGSRSRPGPRRSRPSVCARLRAGSSQLQGAFASADGAPRALVFLVCPLSVSVPAFSWHRHR